MIQPSKFRGVFFDRGNLYTRLFAGEEVYGERIIRAGGGQYREWNPRRSKLAAVIKNGLSELPFERDSRVLYLGAASGTTASHVSDLCPDGKVCCVEVSPRSFRDLLRVCAARPNMFPVKADAHRPDGYRSMAGEVDVIYQDIAQRDQEAVFLKNAGAFLREGGKGILMLKARSVAVAQRPEDVFRRTLESLGRDRRLRVLETLRLEPFHKDHLAISLLWKG
jgi:fibrillarin-like pre-rRNA processing protein